MKDNPSERRNASVQDPGEEARTRVNELPDELPIMPLGTVLFPGGPLSLRIFEPRYLDMVRDCLRDERPFGVCFIESGSEVGEPAEPCRIGTLARIVDWGRDDRGILTIDAVGESRFCIVEMRTRPDHLLIGECASIEEQAIPMPPRFESLARLARNLIERFAARYRHTPPPPPDDSDQCSLWTGYRLSELLPIPMLHRQQLLELDDTLLRLRRIDRAVALIAKGLDEEGVS